VRVAGAQPWAGLRVRPGGRIALALVVALVAGACGLASASWADPIDPLVERLEGYFHGVDITLDPLYTKNPPEVVRLSSVSQLLGYCDLRAAGHPIDPSEIVSRADFLVDQIDLVTSGT